MAEVGNKNKRLELAECTLRLLNEKAMSEFDVSKIHMSFPIVKRTPIENEIPGNDIKEYHLKCIMKLLDQTILNRTKDGIECAPKINVFFVMIMFSMVCGYFGACIHVVDNYCLCNIPCSANLDLWELHCLDHINMLLSVFFGSVYNQFFSEGELQEIAWVYTRESILSSELWKIISKCCNYMTVIGKNLLYNSGLSYSTYSALSRSTYFDMFSECVSIYSIANTLFHVGEIDFSSDDSLCFPIHVWNHKKHEFVPAYIVDDGCKEIPLRIQISCHGEDISPKPGHQLYVLNENVSKLCVLFRDYHKTHGLSSEVKSSVIMKLKEHANCQDIKRCILKECRVFDAPKKTVAMVAAVCENKLLKLAQRTNEILDKKWPGILDDGLEIENKARILMGKEVDSLYYDDVGKKLEIMQTFLCDTMLRPVPVDGQPLAPRVNIFVFSIIYAAICGYMYVRAFITKEFDRKLDGILPSFYGLLEMFYSECCAKCKENTPKISSLNELLECYSNKMRRVVLEKFSKEVTGTIDISLTYNFSDILFDIGQMDFTKSDSLCFPVRIWDVDKYEAVPVYILDDKGNEIPLRIQVFCHNERCVEPKPGHQVYRLNEDVSQIYSLFLDLHRGCVIDKLKPKSTILQALIEERERNARGL